MTHDRRALAAVGLVSVGALLIFVGLWLFWPPLALVALGTGSIVAGFRIP